MGIPVVYILAQSLILLNDCLQLGHRGSRNHRVSLEEAEGVSVRLLQRHAEQARRELRHCLHSEAGLLHCRHPSWRPKEKPCWATEDNYVLSREQQLWKMSGKGLCSGGRRRSCHAVKEKLGAYGMMQL
jgi:hypothetical protein